jgi:UDP-N-acetylmuramoylalanine--D-glutamate ligase
MSLSGLHIIVGLGVTGLSCAHHLYRAGIPFAIMDTRHEPPQLAYFKKTYPHIPLFLGGLDRAILQQASCIVLSPGIPRQTFAIADQVKRGVPVVGDIELFAQAVTAPVIAITGTNAKSTVTTLVGNMAAMAGETVQVGGNLGVPALDLLTHDKMTTLFVLELSSFQLELIQSLKPSVATVLNMTPDHMDRYADMTEYQQAKHRIYQHCDIAICNRDDALTECQHVLNRKLHFTLNTPRANEFGLLTKHSELYLAYEDRELLSVRELPVMGKHYYANALASLAIGYGFGWSFESMLQVLREFKGLPHRCQFVREWHGVKWYNDSKGTNVGATQAAIEGLGCEMQGKIVLIAGGVGKQADFHSLVNPIERYGRHVVLIGQAAKEIAACLGSRNSFSFAATMEEAVQQAKIAAQIGDAVLLSPACASFDMFNHFEHRGDVFMKIVESMENG